MDITKTDQAAALIAQLKLAQTVLAQIQAVGTAGGIIKSAHVQMPDGSMAQMDFDPSLALTAAETNNFGAALATAMQSRVTTLTAAIAAL